MTFKIPAGILDQHIIAIGKTGSGKSSKLRVLVEGLLEANEPVCILDVKGDWWGLKSSADGKRAGFPLVVFGGKHADVPLSAAGGKEIAELVFTGNRPCIIDMRALGQGERARFFIDLASTAYKVTKGKRWLVMSEVHNFCPKGKIFSPQAGEMLHWANKLASEGRGLGLNLLADSQRGQKVHNDFLTSMETLIACKVIHKSDRDAIKDWIDGCADIKLGKQVLDSLAQLKKPEGWVWCPEIDFGPELLQFPLFKTFDSFKPQQADAPAQLKGWADVDLSEVTAKLATVVEEAKANDPKELKRQIAELQRQIKAMPEILEAEEFDTAALEKTRFEEGFKQGQESMREQVQAQLDRHFDKGYKAAAAAISGIVTGVIKAGDEFMVQLRAVTAAIDRSDPEPAAREIWKVPETVVAMVNPGTMGLRKPQRIPGPARGQAGSNGADAPTGARRRIMIALAQNIDGLTARKLGILSGVKEGGSTWRAAFAQLRKDNHIIEDGRSIGLNDGGQRALGSDYDPLPTGEALLNYWRSQFSSTRLAVFNAILKGRGRPIPAEHVAAAAGVELGGSTWRAHMAHLRGLELVSGSEQIAASEDLFS